QWDVVEAAYKKIAPAYDELIRQAAQGDVLHNDDTPMKILDLMKKKKKNKEQKSEDG
ncbi:MAG: transposase, partial [Planctomycetes bacterium]|nr:transposase [Planctomycetota bacterium]